MNGKWVLPLIALSSFMGNSVRADNECTLYGEVGFRKDKLSLKQELETNSLQSRDNAGAVANHRGDWSSELNFDHLRFLHFGLGADCFFDDIYFNAKIALAVPKGEGKFTEKVASNIQADPVLNNNFGQRPKGNAVNLRHQAVTNIDLALGYRFFPIERMQMIPCFQFQLENRAFSKFKIQDSNNNQYNFADSTGRSFMNDRSGTLGFVLKNRIALSDTFTLSCDLGYHFGIQKAPEGIYSAGFMYNQSRKMKLKGPSLKAKIDYAATENLGFFLQGEFSTLSGKVKGQSFAQSNALLANLGTISGKMKETKYKKKSTIFTAGINYNF